MQKKFIGVLLTVVLISFVCCASACESGEDYTAKIEYTYTLDETVTPYWYNTVGKETVIYNEIVVPVQYGGEDVAVGYLAYEPTRIISVRDYTLTKEYSQSDYSVDGNEISVKTDNSMPYIADKWLDGKDVPQEYWQDIIITQYNDKGGTNWGNHVICENAMTRTNFLAVTYAYDHEAQELGFEATEYVPDNFSNVLKKLTAGEAVKILVFGDSISVGASASSMMGFEPMQPTWFDLIKKELAAKYYGGNEEMITLINRSEGGTTSEWGVDRITNAAFDTTSFDLVIIGFGMNDGYEGFGITARTFTSRIEKILDGIREGSPNADYVLLSSFTPNPVSVFAGNHASYVQRLAALAEEKNSSESGCTHIDMYSLSTALLKAKQSYGDYDKRYRYIDISANYTNHPNDYMIRLYAGSILSAMIEFD